MIPFIDLKPYVELVRAGAPADDMFEKGAVYQLLNDLDFLGTSASPTTQRFEAALAAKLGVKHAVAVANGTDAIQLALRAAGIERGHRVAIPNLTFWATLEAVVNVGATPIILDVALNDLQMSFTEFELAHAQRRFDAAILVHAFGWCSMELNHFRGFCRDKRITLIEDGAQAFGVKHDGVSVFADADVATLSFHPAKVIGTIGDGGAVLTNSERTAKRIRALANHGRSAHYEHVTVGWNSRMDAIQAAWLLQALEVSDHVVEERRRLSLRYDARTNDRVRGNGYLFSRGTDNPIATAVHMRAHGVETRHIYSRTIADQPGAHGVAIQIGPLDVSRRFAERVINLPLWYGMTDADVDRCAAAFEEAVRG